MSHILYVTLEQAEYVVYNSKKSTIKEKYVDQYQDTRWNSRKDMQLTTISDVSVFVR